MICAALVYMQMQTPDGYSGSDILQARAILEGLDKIPTYDFVGKRVSEPPRIVDQYLALSPASTEAFHLAHATVSLTWWRGKSAEDRKWYAPGVQDSSPTVLSLVPSIPKSLIDECDFLQFRFSFLYFLMFDDAKQAYNSPWVFADGRIRLIPKRTEVLLGFPYHVASIPGLDELRRIPRRVIRYPMPPLPKAERGK